jgi:nitroreductase
MRPRRDVFGERFISETVRCYEQAVSRRLYDKEELKWARDVLDEYFKVVIDTPTIRAAREIFEHCGRPLPEDVGRSTTTMKAYKPYSASATPETDITFEQLERLFHRRRSVRWYTDASVPSELIQKVVNAASLAPSACNRQPYRVIAANEPVEAQRIAACAGGTPGWSHQIPSILVLVGDLSAYPYERDRHLIYIDGSLAAMQLMLAAETLGLSTCPINWPDVDRSERKLQGMLHLAPHERVIMLLSIGYSDSSGGIPYAQKKTDSRITDEHQS